MEAPKEWPKEISESYDPIRKLGTGGFASVILARQKKQPTDDDANTCISKKVAIKVVGGSDGTSFLYARREIELLQQIRHCGIVQLFHSWEQNEDADENKKTHGTTPTAGVLVLEYIKGPTVESLLKHGGALSTTFGRVIIAQVMDAIAYLHYRAVLHRDIKPDNIIVTGALSSDDFIWDNDDSETVSDRDYKSPEEWKRLCLKYRAKIIDFGFARALTPGDMEEDGPTIKSKRSSSPSRHPKKKDAGYHNVQEDKLNRSQRKMKKKSANIFSSSHHSAISICLEDSVHSVASASHKMRRVMSTLGNRNYAAPEIVNKVREFSAQDKKKELQKDLERRTSETTKTISAFVADYGLLVDSYSMGHTVRYMMTGVQPGISVEDTIKKQQRSAMAKKVLSKFGLGKKKKKKTTTETKGTKEGPRKPQFRSQEDLPGQVVLLIQELTELSPHKRISIRKARRMAPWIADVLTFQTQDIMADNNTSSTTTTSDNDSDSLSLNHCSEEQLHSLTQTRYLPMATNTPGSTIDGTAPTVATTDSNHEFPFDSSGSSTGSNNIVAAMGESNMNKNDDDDDKTGVCLEEDILSF